MGTIGGVREVRVDDLVFRVGDSVSITKNNVTRESVIGLTGYAGNKETHRAGRIEWQMLLDGGVKLSQLESKEDSTVSVITTNGTYVLRNACQCGDLEVAAADGTVTVAFEGPEVKFF